SLTLSLARQTMLLLFFFQAEDGIRDYKVTGVQTCALPILFWHIPWPRNVSRAHVEPIMVIAKALLSCEQIGFHTDEYASNFMSRSEERRVGKEWRDRGWREH